MEKIKRHEKKTVLGYVLNERQNAVLNHLFPSTMACCLFVLIMATDIGVIFRHCKDNNPIWASLTLFFMYLPAIGSFVIIVTDYDCWPEPENGMTNENLFWFYKKTLGHLFFPVWNMWRFAERIFWSIEAAISNSKENCTNAILMATESRLIELYVFLQAYLHSLPQTLLQLHILMRHDNIAKESKNSQALCIILNLAKIAVTTTYYQRFKAQKLSGSQYPWLKKRKILRSTGTSDCDQESVVLRKPSASERRVIENQPNNLDDLARIYDIQPSVLMERRRSSDIYLEPDPAHNQNEITTTIITDNYQAEERIVAQGDSKQSKSVTTKTSYVARFSSAMGFNIKTFPASWNQDPRISRVRYIKGLQEDDVAGRTISFLWWYTFLLSRVLAITAFAYFFFNACVWLLLCHVLLVIIVLLYDVKTDQIRRDKIVFFLFIGIVYIFCIIEFKIRFKKTNLIYFGYFGLTFLENCLMCIVWYFKKLESLESDYWYRYIFYIIIASDTLSLSSIIFYHILSKPKSVSIQIRNA